MDPLTGAAVDTAVGVLARQLRELRSQSGLTYRQMSKIAHYGVSSLADADGGRRLPSWHLVTAYVTACGEDPKLWRARWEAAASKASLEPPARTNNDIIDSGARAVEAIGPTGQRVGRRVAEIRRQRGLTLAELEDKLTGLGRPILLSSLSKIEQGQRRVDADDLVALALALDVSPNRLLLPDGEAFDDAVALTSAEIVNVGAAWSWANRDLPTSPLRLATAAQLDYDFFVSSTHADRPWAEWIAWTLQEVGYRVFYDAWDIKVGDNLVQRLTEALSRSKRVIAIISPNNLASSWVAREWQAAILPRSDEAGPGRRLIPVRVAECALPSLLRDLIYIDLVGLDQTEARSRLQDAVHTAVADVEVGRPQTGPSFPGRAAELERPGAPPGVSNRGTLNIGIFGSTRAAKSTSLRQLTDDPAQLPETSDPGSSDSE